MKTAIIFILFLGMGTTSIAQTVAFGPEIGMQVMPSAELDGNQYYSQGYRAGARVDYNIKDFVGVSSGIFFKNATKTSSNSFTSSLAEESPILGLFLDQAGDLGGLTNVQNDVSITRTMNYLEIPIMANISYKNIYLTIGPQFSLAMSATEDEAITREIALQGLLDSGLLGDDITGGFDIASLLPATSASNSRDYISDLNGMDIGMIVGAGYKMDNVHFNAVYNHSFSDYRKNATGDTDAYSSVRFSVAYLLHTGMFKTATPTAQF